MQPRFAQSLTAETKKASLALAFFFTSFGSTTWTRTRDPVINSHLLYQLSYRGMRAILLIGKGKSSGHIKKVVALSSGRLHVTCSALA